MGDSSAALGMTEYYKSAGLADSYVLAKHEKNSRAFSLFGNTQGWKIGHPARPRSNRVPIWNCLNEMFKQGRD